MSNIITLSNTEKHLPREYFTRVSVNGHSRRSSIRREYYTLREYSLQCETALSLLITWQLQVY